MKNKETNNHAKLRISIILVTIAVILSIPLIAMQFINQVKWTLIDFVAAGILLLTTGLAIELVIRNVKTNISRTVLLVIILIVTFLVWAELAVGIFGTPFAGS
ncbi:hypothetical protein DU508_05020 [Pedobacter chinensis]|uniref:Uncharacterized protein n=2 Tax=Pedobacter chinensis TaxID=2282421 RepID=A0A369Q0G4_9SPHI|nr:hypothetical protein DU508_05020 [Pedobacter chinensis]